MDTASKLVNLALDEKIISLNDRYIGDIYGGNMHRT